MAPHDREDAGVPVPTDRLPLGTRLAARIGHLYPFLSGCGTFANTRLMRRFDPTPPRNLIVAVQGGYAHVPSDDYVGRAMLYVGDLDRKISALIDAVLRPGDVALDIGANLGLVSLRLAHRVGPEGTVHVFEPNPRLVPYLSATLAANPDLNITLHPIALGRKRATLPLHVPPGNAGAATLRPDRSARAETTVEVPLRPLADYAAEMGLERLDFLKIDVEGFEGEVLIGAAPLLERLQPRVVVLEENTEVAPEALPPALAVLSRVGYALYALPRRLFRLELVPLDHPEAAAAHDYVAFSGRDAAEIRRRLSISDAG